MPTCKQFDFKQIKSIRFPDYAITQSCQFGFLGAFGNDKRLVHFLVLDDVVLEHIGLLGRMVLYQSEINLSEIAVFHLDGHAGEGLARLGEHDGATHGAVNTVDEAGKDVPRLVVLHFDVFFHVVEQAYVARFVALHDFRGELVDDY